jgi:hypothetical protein
MHDDLHATTQPRQAAPEGACKQRLIPAERTSSEALGTVSAISTVSVWDHVIRALHSGPETVTRPAVRRAPRAKLTGASRHPDAPSASCHAQIEVLERLSARTITILWQDATRCRYVDQVWTRCRARVIGRCAITGVAITRDDIVFKPRSRGLFPGNARAMILASAITGLPEFDVDSVS